MQRAWMGLMVAGAVSACTGPEPIDTGEPRPHESAIEVTPQALTFQDVLPGATAEGKIQIRALGPDASLVSGVQVSADDAFVVTGMPGIAPLSEGDIIELDVEYWPTELSHQGWIDIHTDDADKPVHRVLLAGGIEPAELVWMPDELDFGNVLPGDVGELSVQVSNIGGLPADLEDAVLDIDGPFAFGERVELGAIATGETRYIDVTFAPQSLVDFVYEGFLDVQHNQGDAHSVPIRATSQNTPIAVCEAIPDIVPALTGVTSFDGSASYNPEGGDIVSWTWTLVSAPAGTAATLPTTSGPVVDGFMPDQAGPYVVQLIVENEMGVQSEPCEATVTASVGDQLWVEMFWQTDDDDMDLHLVQNDGELNSGDDCHWSNCKNSPLQWGDPGSTLDNPSLDRDDIDDTGPENINIEVPAPGTYHIWVHDYPGSPHNGANQVTVNIYVFGILETTITKTITGEDSFTQFADVVYPGGIITEF